MDGMRKCIRVVPLILRKDRYRDVIFFARVVRGSVMVCAM